LGLVDGDLDNWACSTVRRTLGPIERVDGHLNLLNCETDT